MLNRMLNVFSFVLMTVLLSVPFNGFAQNFGSEFALTKSPATTSLSTNFLESNESTGTENLGLNLNLNSELKIEPQGMPTRKGQAIFFEVLGAGLTYSFNYDTRFQQTRDGLGIRVGASYIGDVNDGGILTVPVQINHLMGKNNKYFELGIGATYASATGILDEGDSDTVVGTMTFGYRLQPEDGGFLFRISMTPVLVGDIFFPFYGGVSFGYAF